MAVLRPEKKEFVRYLVERFGCHAKFAALEYEHIRIHFHQVAVKRPPELAPEFFSTRDDQSETAIEFLERVYGEWLRGNGLYRFHLRKLDPVLMTMLEHHYRASGRRDEFELLLPTKSSQVTERIGADLPVGDPERLRLMQKKRLEPLR